MIGPLICCQMMKYLRRYFSTYSGPRECEQIYNKSLGKQFRLKLTTETNQDFWYDMVKHIIPKIVMDLHMENWN
ncbi:hypothetical protein DERP_001703 [Dermatophagoides pteronyssinus]|uniref:Uncharacterized protein n=1 Tax=Dermatophagoides pteronyssinus TaxID=6956 RepID=A0ABQ8JB92_DERPT|nr:hypothetical protein DERP_001703 [Dermatophagoides pteronyssinus]